ncbi:MAG: hypothetical protein E7158_01025 [Firmicutes bacterium]|nr:hypothetical protein [Bacillota bacterium]
MENTLLIILTETFIVLILVFIAMQVIKSLKSYDYEKKFSDFSLLSVNDREVSLYEKIATFFFKLVYKVSKLINVSKVIEKHSSKFDRDSKVNGRIRNGLDFISIKILVGIFLSICTFFTIIVKGFSFDFIKILIGFIVGYFTPNIIIVYRRNRNKKRVEDDLLKAIIIMNNSFKSGRNIMQAIETVKTELDGPIAEEFKKISLDISYGLSLDTVFSRFYNRVKIEDAKYIASSLTLLNKTGGNIIKVFNMIENSFFDKKKLKTELSSLTASSVFVFRILALLPLIFVALITVLNNQYFLPLFSSSIGFGILILILSLYAMYIYVIKKLLKVEI